MSAPLRDGLTVLDFTRVLAGPIAHPHLAVREAFPAVDHPARVTATPVHVDGQPTHPAGPAPSRAGEHTRLVRREILGYPESRIETLRVAGVIQVS